MIESGALQRGILKLDQRSVGPIISVVDHSTNAGAQPSLARSRYQRKRNGKQGVSGFCALLVFVAMATSSSQSMATGSSTLAWNLEDGKGALAAMIGANLANLGTGIANGYYASRSEHSPVIAYLSYVSGAVGVVSGGLGYASNNQTVRAVGGATIALSLVNVGLATWNLTQGKSSEHEDNVLLSPATLMDSMGNQAPGVAVAGSF